MSRYNNQQPFDDGQAQVPFDRNISSDQLDVGNAADSCSVTYTADIDDAEYSAQSGSMTDDAGDPQSGVSSLAWWTSSVGFKMKLVVAVLIIFLVYTSGHWASPLLAKLGGFTQGFHLTTARTQPDIFDTIGDSRDAVDNQLHQMMNGDTVKREDVDTLQALLAKVDGDNRKLAASSQARQTMVKLQVDRYLAAYAKDKTLVWTYGSHAVAVARAFKTCSGFPYDTTSPTRLERYREKSVSCQTAFKPLKTSDSAPIRTLATNIDAGVQAGLDAVADPKHGVVGGAEPGASQSDHPISQVISQAKSRYRDDVSRERAAQHVDWTLRRARSMALFIRYEDHAPRYGRMSESERSFAKAVYAMKLRYRRLGHAVSAAAEYGMGDLGQDDIDDITNGLAALEQANTAFVSLPQASKPTIKTGYDAYMQGYDKDKALIRDFAQVALAVSNANAVCRVGASGLSYDDATYQIYTDYTSSCRSAVAPFKDSGDKALRSLQSSVARQMDSYDGLVGKLKAFGSEDEVYGSGKDAAIKRYNALKNDITGYERRSRVNQAFLAYGKGLDKQHVALEVQKLLSDLEFSRDVD